MNTKVVLYSRFRGFGLLCFLRDIFTTHNTNTCHHCSRDTTTIMADAGHTSTPCSVLRATEAKNSCKRAARQDILCGPRPPKHVADFQIFIHIKIVPWVEKTCTFHNCDTKAINQHFFTINSPAFCLWVYYNFQNRQRLFILNSINQLITVKTKLI